MLKRNECVFIDSAQTLPPGAEKEIDVMKVFGLQSLVVVPLMSAGRLFGVSLFGSLTLPKFWQEDIRTHFLSIGELFANVLDRRQREERLSERERLLENVFSSIKDGICVHRRGLPHPARQPDHGTVVRAPHAAGRTQMLRGFHRVERGLPVLHAQA
jgi:GAF domain-containing protein